MPRLDAYIPEGALSADAENNPLSALTDILLGNEGADPADPTSRSIVLASVQAYGGYGAVLDDRSVRGGHRRKRQYRRARDRRHQPSQCRVRPGQHHDESH